MVASIRRKRLAAELCNVQGLLNLSDPNTETLTKFEDATGQMAAVQQGSELPVGQFTSVLIIVWSLYAVSIKVIGAKVLMIIPLLHRCGSSLVKIFNLQPKFILSNMNTAVESSCAA